MENVRIKVKGFTLLELLLVLAIISTVLAMFLNFTTQKSDEVRRDKAVLQIEQILNAGLAYYINNGAWPVYNSTPTQDCSSGSTQDWYQISGSPAPTPTGTSQLQPNYIPSTLNNSPYYNPYNISCSTPVNGGVFYVGTQVGGVSGNASQSDIVNAQIIASRLPMAFITDGTTSGVDAVPPVQSSACSGSNVATLAGNNCNFVVAAVNTPGQNLNNARSINLANIYHSGACVPVPSCPSGMSPSINIAVAAAYGANDAGTTNVYPISGFAAFTVGPGTATGTGGTAVPACFTGESTGCPLTDPGSGSSESNIDQTGKTQYWKVCVDVVTGGGSGGDVPTTNTGTGTNGWAQYQSVLATTRCAPTNENYGNTISAFSP